MVVVVVGLIAQLRKLSLVAYSFLISTDLSNSHVTSDAPNKQFAYIMYVPECGVSKATELPQSPNVFSTSYDESSAVAGTVRTTCTDEHSSQSLKTTNVAAQYE
jgi:hypothetical protein